MVFRVNNKINIWLKLSVNVALNVLFAEESLDCNFRFGVCKTKAYSSFAISPIITAHTFRHSQSLPTIITYIYVFFSLLKYVTAERMLANVRTHYLPSMCTGELSKWTKNDSIPKRSETKMKWRRVATVRWLKMIFFDTSMCGSRSNCLRVLFTSIFVDSL